MTGGTVQNGTYILTSFTIYNEDGCETGDSAQMTFEFSGAGATTLHYAVAALGQTASGTSSVVYVGNEALLTETCGDTLTSPTYTASGGTLTAEFTDEDGSTSVLVFTAE
jgi:hypothetical protein